jgi:hypothetical protein
MQTRVDSAESDNPPVSCSVCLTEDRVIGTGRVWAFYQESCHVESALRVSPGMIVSLSLQLQSGARVKLETGLVTWVGRSEFGLRFLHEPATRPQERRTS